MKKTSIVILLLMLIPLYVMADVNDDLFKGIERGKINVVKNALEDGADVNARDKKSGWTALMVATVFRKVCANKGYVKLEKSYVEIIKYLISKGADVNAKAKGGSIVNNALLKGAKKGQLKVVKNALNKGADIKAKDKRGRTAIILASDWNQSKVLIKYLISKGANVNDSLIAATKIGEIEIVKSLVSKGADVNFKDYKGRTALSEASNKGYLKVVKFLVSKDVNVNTKSSTGMTALMRASRWGYLEVVKYLLSKGAIVNTKTNTGMTALMNASSGGHLEIVKYLISKGADINAKGNGLTVSNWALKFRKFKVVKYLKSLNKK